MARPKKPYEHTLFDEFADAPLADQEAMLRILTELHRQKRRTKSQKAEPAPSELIAGAIVEDAIHE